MQFRLLSGKHFFRHFHVDLQGQKLAQGQQHANDKETQKPKGGSIGQIDLVIDADQPQQNHDDRHTRTQARRAAADGGQGGRTSDGRRG